MEAMRSIAKLSSFTLAIAAVATTSTSSTTLLWEVEGCFEGTTPRRRYRGGLSWARSMRGGGGQQQEFKGEGVSFGSNRTPSSNTPEAKAVSHAFPPPDVPTFSADAFWLTRRLGTGKFSDVFEAIRGGDDYEEEEDDDDDDYNDQLVVIKCLKPVSDRKVRREVAVLRHAQQLMSDGDGAINVVRLLGVVLPSSSDDSDGDKTSSEFKSDRRHHPRSSPPPMPSLVLEHAGPNSQWLCHPITSATATAATTTSSSFPLSEYEIRYYVCHLLAALRDLHRLGIMHRDVKPRNVLINRTHMSVHSDAISRTGSHNQIRPLLLIDLGLADFYTPNAPYNVRVASRHYKSPELLLGYPYYTPSLDLWGVGCVLAGLLLRREPFFRGRDNSDQLFKIVSVLGTRDLDRYVEKYGIAHPEPSLSSPGVSTPEEEHAGNDHDASRGGWHCLPPKERMEDWNAMRGPDCPAASSQGFDLLNHLLVYDHQDRYTAEQAIDHPFFDPVRERVNAEIQAIRQVEQWKKRRKAIRSERKEESPRQEGHQQMSSSASSTNVNDAGQDRRPAQRQVPESALSFLSLPTYASDR